MVLYIIFIVVIIIISRRVTIPERKMIVNTHFLASIIQFYLQRIKFSMRIHALRLYRIGPKKIYIGGNNNRNIWRYCIVTNFISCGQSCSCLIHYNIIIIYYYNVYTIYIAMHGGNSPMNRQRRHTFRKKNNFRSSLSSRSK